MAVLTNPHLTSVRNFDTGFDHFHNLRTEGDDRAENNSDTAEENNLSLIDRLRGRFKQSNRKYSPTVFPFIGYRYHQYRTDWPSIGGKTLREEFCRQLNSTESPFFAWTHLMDPHAPISPQVTEADESLDNKIGTVSHLYHIGNHSRNYHDPAYDRIYDSSIRYIDSQIGEIINTLQSMGQWEETIFIVTGDHGEVLNDRMGIRGHPRHHHYDELLRVPLLVRVPDFEGERIERPISLAWVPKLITELLHLPSGDFPYERGEPTIFEAENEANPPVISDSLDRHGHTITIRDDRHKLIHHKEDNNTLNTSYPYFTENISFQYRTDPTERNPIQKHSKNELQTVVHDIATEQDAIPNIKREFSQAIENRLKDLGYKMD